MTAYSVGVLFPKKALNKSLLVVDGSDCVFFFRCMSHKHHVFGFRHAYAKILRTCHAVIAVSRFTLDRFFDELAGLIGEVGSAEMPLAPHRYCS